MGHYDLDGMGQLLARLSLLPDQFSSKCRPVSEDPGNFSKVVNSGDSQ